MEEDTKHYVEYLNHDPNWLKKITIEIDMFLVDCEYIDLFMQIYIQCIIDDGDSSSSKNLTITCLPSFEKLALPQFQVYIEAQTMTQCVLCNNLKNTIIV